MNYEELVECKKSIGSMSKEELFTYCNGLLDEIWEFEKLTKELLKENGNKEKVIKAQDNIINKAIEIYENRNSIEYKKKRFMEDKTIGYYMYEELKGVDKE